MFRTRKKTQPDQILFKKKLHNIFSFFPIFWSNFIKSFQALFFGFIFPTFLFIIISLINLIDTSYLWIIIMLPPVTLGIMSLGNTITEWKSSVFLKRIDATPISKTEFLFSLILFYTLISFMGIVWLMIVGVIYDAASGMETFSSSFNFGWFLLACLEVSFLSISIGVFIGGVAQSEGSAQGIGMAIYFPCILFSGILFPASLLDKVDALRYISYILPTKYGVFVNQYAWTGTFNLDNSFTEFSQNWIAPVIAFLWIIIFNVINKFTFKLTSVKR